MKIAYITYTILLSLFLLVLWQPSTFLFVLGGLVMISMFVLYDLEKYVGIKISEKNKTNLKKVHRKIVKILSSKYLYTFYFIYSTLIFFVILPNNINVENIMARLLYTALLVVFLWGCIGGIRDGVMYARSFKVPKEEAIKSGYLLLIPLIYLILLLYLSLH